LLQQRQEVNFSAPEQKETMMLGAGIVAAVEEVVLHERAGGAAGHKS
jgi:hypothetical protein